MSPISNFSSYSSILSFCGNGRSELPEECDDGNNTDFDGCSFNCKLEDGRCGDGVVQTLLGEQCEEQVQKGLTYFCGTDCRYHSLLCGDGVTDIGEECDDGLDNSVQGNVRCRPTCSLMRCGDGTLDNLTEQCDDGNNLPADGCNRFCQVEFGAPLPQALPASLLKGMSATSGSLLFPAVAGSQQIGVPVDAPGVSKVLLAPPVLDMDRSGMVEIDELQKGLVGAGAATVDSDRDGMPDDWERAFGLDPYNGRDALLDLDKDGLPNLLEWLQGTHPLRAEVQKGIVGAGGANWTSDSDKDGMPDAWEMNKGLNAFDARDAAGDLNRNGVTNLQEWRAQAGANDVNKGLALPASVLGKPGMLNQTGPAVVAVMAAGAAGGWTWLRRRSRKGS